MEIIGNVLKELYPDNEVRDYYVYLHIKKDGTVFYVGIGKKPSSKLRIRGHRTMYCRAYQRGKRNPLWFKVAMACDYSIDIHADHLTKEEGVKIESKLISRYGRLLDGTGTLCNYSSPLDSGNKRRNIILRISQLTLNGELVKIWRNPDEIQRESKYLKTNIVKCCRNKQVTAYGYRWQYSDNQDVLPGKRLCIKDDLGVKSSDKKVFSKKNRSIIVAARRNPETGRFL